MTADPLTILAEDTNRISYRPRLNAVTGGVLPSILLQQMLYWWKKSKGQPFYKFAGPCKHPLYKEGDSWQEELGFSRSELTTALTKIATKINRNDSKVDALQSSLVICWTGFDRLTWYEVNEPLLREKLAEVYALDVMLDSRNATIQHYDVMLDSGITQNLHSVMQDSDIQYCRNPEIDRSETTSETTSEKNTFAATPQPTSRKKKTTGQGEAEQQTLIATGTPTPHSAPPPSPHQAMMTAYGDALGYPIPNGAREGKAAKWLIDNQYTPEQMAGCYEAMKADTFWSDKHLSLQKVCERIGAWVQTQRPKARVVPPIPKLNAPVPLTTADFEALTPEQRKAVRMEHYTKEQWMSLPSHIQRTVRFQHMPRAQYYGSA